MGIKIRGDSKEKFDKIQTNIASMLGENFRALKFSEYEGFIHWKISH